MRRREEGLKKGAEGGEEGSSRLDLSVVLPSHGPN